MGLIDALSNNPEVAGAYIAGFLGGAVITIVVVVIVMFIGRDTGGAP